MERPICCARFLALAILCCPFLVCQNTFAEEKASGQLEAVSTERANTIETPLEQMEQTGDLTTPIVPSEHSALVQASEKEQATEVKPDSEPVAALSIPKEPTETERILRASSMQGAKQEPTGTHSPSPEASTTDTVRAEETPASQDLSHYAWLQPPPPGQDLSHYSWLQPPPPYITREGQAFRAKEVPVKQKQAQDTWWWQRQRSYEISQRIYWRQCAGCHGVLPPAAVNALVHYKPLQAIQGMRQLGNVGQQGGGPMYFPQNRWPEGGGWRR